MNASSIDRVLVRPFRSDGALVAKIFPSFIAISQTKPSDM